MAWDEARFERFIEALVRLHHGELAGYGYPQVILPYPPVDEATCIAAVRQLPSRLDQKGIRCEVVPVAPKVAEALTRYTARTLEEADDYRRLESDLSDPRNGAVGRTVEKLAPELLERQTDGRLIVLCRLGALYPFGHVSALLDQLHQRGVRNLGVVYPGTADGTTLRFLGRLDPTGAYRGHIVT
jgi:microsomal dipeptidase-like Zn-dependent dipeptidase